jgi:hypothetical protein
MCFLKTNIFIKCSVDDDRKKYGALLPRTGVFFMPDEKVVGFLK